MAVLVYYRISEPEVRRRFHENHYSNWLTCCSPHFFSGSAAWQNVANHEQNRQCCFATEQYGAKNGRSVLSALSLAILFLPEQSSAPDRLNQSLVNYGLSALDRAPMSRA